MTGAASADANRHRPWIVGFVALLLLAALLVGFVSVNNTSQRQRQRAEAAYVHTLNVLLVTGELKTSLNEALRGERGYLLTADARALDVYRRGRNRAPELVARLERLTRDDLRQRAYMPVLAARLETLNRVMDRTIQLRSTSWADDAMRVARAPLGPQAASDVFAVLDAVEREERRLLQLRRAEAARARANGERLSTILDIKAVLLLLVVGAAAYRTYRVQRRLAVFAQDLERAVVTDALTGLANRRAVWERLGSDVERARTSGQPLSLAVLDIDHFKRINDTHGHPAGDAVIVTAATRMTAVLRAGDFVGRIGGEEFALVMPGTDEAAAAAVCERLRLVLAAEPVTTGADRTIPITVSTGVASLIGGESGDSLFSRADKALYAAKRAGRNQVKVAAPDAPGRR